MKGRTLVVVPAFNEAINVGRLLEEIRALPDPLDVVVVDHGPVDATAGAAVAGGAARAPPAVQLRHRGRGADWTADRSRGGIGFRRPS